MLTIKQFFWFERYLDKVSVYNFSTCYSNNSLGAANDRYLWEKDLIAEISTCWSTFLPNYIFKQQRGCVCKQQISQIWEISGLRWLSCIGSSAVVCQKNGYQKISATTAFGVCF